MAYSPPKNLSATLIKKQVIRVEKLLGEKNKFRDVAFKKQILLNEKKEFEQREKNLETGDNPDDKEKQVSNKLPVPRLGFLDAIKNFLFKILLGAFTIKLLPQLPKLKAVLIGAMKFSDFILEFSGSILNAFATFIDKVYQIVDFGKQQAKLLGGDKGLQEYNKTLDVANKVMNAMFIAGMLFSDLAESDAQASSKQQVVEAIRDRVVEQGAQRAAQQAAIRGAAQFGARAAAGTVAGVGLISSALGEGAFQLRKFTTKIQKDVDESYKESLTEKNPFMRFIKSAFYNTFVRPGLMFTNFLLNGLGTLLDVVGAPFRYAIELINYGIMMLTGDSEGIKKQRENLGKFDARIREQIREMVNTLSFGTLVKEKGSFGSLFGSDATKAMGYAEGGAISRGGTYMGAVTRTEGKKVKAKRIVSVPTAPLQPGSDVGGMAPHKDEKQPKIEVFYQNSSDPGTVNGFEYLKRAYDISGSTKFLHPLLEISIKSLMGDKPAEGDFRAIGVGLNNFLNDILDTTKIPGGDSAISDETGPIDISNWIAEDSKKSIMNPINSILLSLSKQLTLKRNSSEGGPVSPSAQTGGSVQENPLAQFGGTAQFVIGDSIAHGFAGRSGNGTDTSDTQVGRGPAAVLSILKSKGDSLKGALIDLSTGIANSTGDWSSVEEQLKYLKSIGARVRILGVSDSFSKEKGGINEKLAQLASKYGFYFYGGYKGGKDKLHGTDEDYTNLKSKREADTAQFKPESTELGKGYGSAGVKIAGELGRYIYQRLRSPEQFLAVTEHPEFGGVKGTHANGSYHYSNRAIDIGAYTREQGPILKVIADFNRMKNIKPAELLHGRNDSGHSDHVHVAYKDGGPIFETKEALTHPGEYVVDADSVRLFGIKFYDIINKVETASQRKNAAESLISILSQYTEDGYPETEDDYTYYIPESSTKVMVAQPSIIPSPSMGGSGYGSEGQDPSKDILFM